MIRTDAEYKAAVERLREEAKRHEEYRRKLAEESHLAEEEITRAMAPMLSFYEQLKEEVEYYERIKRGDFRSFHSVGSLGSLLVALRISQGMTQRELAERLGVHESQVSRDERNEYHGLTVEKAQRILTALGGEVRVEVERVGGELVAV
jgi:DNA-directed RNA polymerase specialized sigma subunit